MSNKEILEAALRNLSSLPDYLDFHKSYTINKSLDSLTDFNAFFDSYKNYLSQRGVWKSDYDILLNIIIEKSNTLKVDNSPSPIFQVNSSRKLNDNWVTDFKTQLYSCLTGDAFAEEVKPKTYKTITENIIVFGVEGEKLSQLFSKYSKFNHPLVNYRISSILYNAKNYSQGLPILKDGIKSIATYPNFYWNNEYGIEGASWMIADLLSLLGDIAFHRLNMQELKRKLLKLLYLYISRYIYMTNSNLESINFYSNRARIVKAFYNDFMTIFQVGVNPDIQFISDMFLAYQTAVNNEYPITEPIRQFYWDSMKMYRHGSLIPNSTDGYQGIEDDTWMELVQKGEARSIYLANQLLKEFESYELNISNSEIDQLFDYLKLTYPDNMEGYFKELNERKIR